MSILYTNRAKAQLARTITASDTTLSVLSGTGALFPTITQSGDFFPVTLVSVSSGSQYEIAYCIARNGDTMTLIRGQEGTTPVAFQSGDIVSLNMTSAAYRRLPQAGYLGQFSQEVANSPDGYRKGAIVCDDTPGAYWISLINQNTTAPNANNQTWRKLDTNGLLHPPDISGLVSGAAFNGTPYQNDFSVSNVGVNKVNGTPWFYSPNGGGVINLALQSALQQEVQRAQAAEAGLLPLTGGTLTGDLTLTGNTWENNLYGRTLHSKADNSQIDAALQLVGTRDNPVLSLRTVNESGGWKQWAFNSATGNVVSPGGGVLPEVLGMSGRVVIQAFVATGRIDAGYGHEAWVSFPASFASGTIPVISIAITRETGGNYVSRFPSIGVFLNTSTPNINNTGFSFQPAYADGGTNTSGGQWAVQVIAIGVMQ